MASSIVRSDKWHLQATEEQKRFMRLTVAEYRAFCRALSFVVLNNWPQLQKAPSFAAAVERLIHRTTKNPHPRHRYFTENYYKFPAYLRRAAIEFVKGQVSSYLTRYRAWVSGDRARRDAKPPVFRPESGCYPSLYRGQLIKFGEKYKTASLKLWDGKEWLWHDMAVKGHRKRHEYGKLKSPALIIGKSCHLSVPIQIRPVKLEYEGVVCSVDVGINTTATVTIVAKDGTVAARKFIHPGADIDRRNKHGDTIRRKARQTAGKGGSLFKGFCKHFYRKVRNINEQIAQIVSRQIVDFALEHGADVIVLEDLKYWRPKGGRRRSALKQRFHQWMHRRLADLVEAKFHEAGGQVQYVYARGTSSWAFDGSGQVKRGKKQYELATFQSGKRYNADLNAAYNIAARYWAKKLKLTERNDGQLSGGRSPSGKPRVPVTLSTLWAHAKRVAESEAPHLCEA